MLSVWCVILLRIDNTSDPTAHFLQLNWSLPCHRHRESRRTVGAKTGWLLPSGKFDQPQGSNAEIFGESKLRIPAVNGHFRNLNWRYLPYIRPI